MPVPVPLFLYQMRPSGTDRYASPGPSAGELVSAPATCHRRVWRGAPGLAARDGEGRQGNGKHGRKAFGVAVAATAILGFVSSSRIFVAKVVGAALAADGDTSTLTTKG